MGVSAPGEWSVILRPVLVMPLCLEGLLGLVSPTPSGVVADADDVLAFVSVGGLDWRQAGARVRRAREGAEGACA